MREELQAKLVENVSERPRIQDVTAQGTNDCYSVLGVSPNAGKKEIREVYKDLLSVWDPARFTGNLRLQEKARERTQKLDEAYEELIKRIPENSEDGRDKVVTQRATPPSGPETGA